MRCIMILSTIFILPTIGLSATYYVPDDFPKIQDAIRASVNGDTIMVRPGTYVENIDFLGKSVKVVSEKGPEVTTIDANQSGSVVTFKSGETNDSLLRGFTITGGSGTPCPGGMLGGGIFIDASSPTIDGNIVIQNNLGGGNNHGGGIYCRNSSATITKNHILDNHCHPFAFQSAGGGVAIVNSTDVLLMGNIIAKNTAGGDGDPGSKSMSAFGGGVFFSASTGNIINSIIFDNRIHGHDFTDGAGVMLYYYSTINVLNSTISDNDVYDGGWSSCYDMQIGKGSNTGSGNVYNSIIWIHGNSSHRQFSGLTIYYSDVIRGSAGIGNIDSDPLFVDYASGDYHLTFNSPCRGSGDSAVPGLPDYDFEGDPRIHQDTVDMGADEFHRHLYYTGNATPGGAVDLKFIDLPGSTPVGFWISPDALETPIHCGYGDWHLAFPIYGPWFLLPIPSTGVEVISGALPSSPPGPYDLFMQAIMATPMKLTNLCALHVE